MFPAEKGLKSSKLSLTLYINQTDLEYINVALNNLEFHMLKIT